MTPLAAYLLLFVAVGIGFILVHLVAGSLLRPSRPDAEKGTIYECGEPTIGSAWIQFDLRYYVVALLFVIFDVEVAFFFPWAEVFGKANAVANARKPTTASEYRDYAEKVLDLANPRGKDKQSVQDFRHYDQMKEATQTQLNEALERQKQAASRVVAGQQPDAEDMETLRQIGMLRRRLVDLGSTDSQLTEWDENREKSQSLALIALCEMLGFFGVLLVGFAYLWRRGDLEWVRSTAAEKQTPAQGVAKTESKAATMAGSK